MNGFKTKSYQIVNYLINIQSSEFKQMWKCAGSKGQNINVYHFFVTEFIFTFFVSLSFSFLLFHCPLHTFIHRNASKVALYYSLLWIKILSINSVLFFMNRLLAIAILAFIFLILLQSSATFVSRYSFNLRQPSSFPPLFIDSSFPTFMTFVFFRFILGS